MMISNMAPYSSICLKTAPNMLPEAPRTVQDGSNKPQTPQGSPQEAQTQQQLHENLCCLHRHPFASDGFPKPNSLFLTTNVLFYMNVLFCTNNSRLVNKLCYILSQRKDSISVDSRLQILVLRTRISKPQIY